MPSGSPLTTTLRLVVRESAALAGAAAASAAADLIRDAVRMQGAARVLFASAPSQIEMIEALKAELLPWSQVTALHLDEYVGIPAQDPRSFGQWLRNHLFDEVRPGAVELIRPDADPLQECRRYGEVLDAGPIDLACIGIGVNGHLAFNEPYQWTIDDLVRVRTAHLDTASRQQQVDDGCFASLAEVPTRAMTLTVAAVLASRHLVVMVPGAHKADAVARTVDGPVIPAVPASALQTHPAATLFLDRAAARQIRTPISGGPS